MQVFEAVEVPRRCRGCRAHVPGAFLLVEGFEAVQATIPSRGTCRAHVPGATLLIEILKAVQVAMPSRSTCRIHVPGAALLVEILEAVKAIIFHHR